MATTAADILIDALSDWGVEVIFGMPGDGINGIMEALRTRQDTIRFIQVRHEEAAAFMACALRQVHRQAWASAWPPRGPGGLHLLNGLYDAKMDGQPVLAITGHHFHDLIGTHAQQDVDLDRVFTDVAVYNTRIMGPSHVETVTDLACRTALSLPWRGPSELPRRSPGARGRRTLEAQPPRLTGLGRLRAAARRLPAEDELRRAAAILNAGQKVAMLAGRGALHATDELEQVAETLGGADRQGPAGQGGGPGRQPVHHRRRSGCSGPGRRRKPWNSATRC